MLVEGNWQQILTEIEFFIRLSGGREGADTVLRVILGTQEKSPIGGNGAGSSLQGALFKRKVSVVGKAFRCRVQLKPSADNHPVVQKGGLSTPFRTYPPDLHLRLVAEFSLRGGCRVSRSVTLGVRI